MGTADENRRHELNLRALAYFHAVERDDDATIREMWAMAEVEPDWRFVLVGCAMAWFGRDR